MIRSWIAPRITDTNTVLSSSAGVVVGSVSGAPISRVRKTCRNVIGTRAIATIAIRRFHCERYSLIAASRISPTPIGCRPNGRSPRMPTSGAGGGGSGGEVQDGIEDREGGCGRSGAG